ncbi:MAG: DNA polymerase III subunit delta [Lachnospiraceae bacterium]|nr:DNA polymerase III subunit delta [Lachnospiraceae bacterium]
MKQLAEDIRSGQLKKVYLLFGDEPFLIRSFKWQLKAAAVGEDTMNLQVFSGKKIDPQDVIAAADTMPMFADRRFVLVENSGWFKKEGKAVADYLPEMPETTMLVFAETDVDKRSALYKQVANLGYAAELRKQTPATLETWAAGILAKSGKKITREAASDFVDRVGDDMFRLRNELDKLISYLGDREVVTREDLDAVCVPQVTGRVFDMVGAISRRDRRMAMELYAELLSLREPPMRIISLIGRQYQQLLICMDEAGRTADPNQIAKVLGVKPFVVQKLRQVGRGYSRADLENALDACVRAETSIKNGNMRDRTAAELLILELSAKA